MVKMQRWRNRTNLSIITSNCGGFQVLGLSSGECSSAPKMKMFVCGLKPEVFREVYSRAFETLVDVMADTRHELANYRDIIELSERIKRPEPKKEAKDRTLDGHISRKQGSYSKAPGRLSTKTRKYLIPRRQWT